MVAGILLSPLCCATQQATSTALGNGSNNAGRESTEEILVRGTRLRELRAAIVTTENRFYKQYNALNKVDDFDIECVRDAHTGTRIPQRRCLTRVVREAMARQGSEAAEYFQQQATVHEYVPGQTSDSAQAGDPGPAGMTGRGRPPNTDPTAVWAARYDEYRDNMLYLLKMHPELRQLASEGEAARKRYDAEYQRRLKGRLVLFE
jgi:hypothetical protein